jgi:peptide/nickel transport system substrate-binding protein
MTSPESTAQEIAKNLDKAGIKVTLRGVKWEKYYEKLRFGDYQAALSGFTGIDYWPEMYFQLFWGRNNTMLGGTNATFYINERIFRLVYKLQDSQDKNEKIRLMREIQDIVSQDCPIIPLFHNRTLAVVNKRVMGLCPDKNGIIDFSNVWIDK